MPADEFTPTKVVKLAKPGQIAGYGRAIRKDVLDDDYREAIAIASDNPGMPVIVHEWTLPADADKAKAVRRYINQEVRTSLSLANEIDQRGEFESPIWPLDASGNKTIDSAIERIQVSQATVDDGDQRVRTYVQFQPTGRRIRQRAKRGAVAAAEAARESGHAHDGEEFEPTKETTQ